MAESTTRPRPAFLRALGKSDPPEQVTICGRTFERTEIYKHDSWAATACYARPGERIVCKFNRVQPVGPFDFRWLGQRLAERERRALERLDDLPHIPQSLGDVLVDGRRQVHAIARRYVAGHPLKPEERVGPRFFARLETLLHTMHARGIAYVDLHKRENIIVGNDGQPYLIDFQIGFDITHPRVRWWPAGSELFEMLCRSDLYHLQKHVLRHDPARQAHAEAELERLRPWWIRAHRLAAVPLRQARRRLLTLLGVRNRSGMVESEQFVEDALRPAA